MKCLRIFLLLLFNLTLIFSIHRELEAGGGYVGNGPTPAALALLTPSFRPPTRYQLENEEVDSYRNYFLLKKFEIEVQTGVFFYQSSDPILRITREGLVPGDGGYNQSEDLNWHWNPSFDFGVGLSSNITWHGLTNLSFGVVNNDGHGYEMAVSVGLTTNGVNGEHDYPYVSYFTPGLSILQTWSEGRFRIVNSTFGSVVMLSDFEWQVNELGSSFYLFYDLLSNLRVGAGVGGVFYKVEGESLFDEPELLGPSASLTYRVFDNMSLSLTTRFQPKDTVLPQPGMVLGVRW